MHCKYKASNNAGTRKAEINMKKNEVYKILIEDMSDTGEGIGHLAAGLPEDGMTFFVKDAVVGDVVLAGVTKVKKNYCYARVVEIIMPSKDRTEPVCPVARPCGGCQLQSMTYGAQLRFKTSKVKNCFKRIAGIDVEVNDIIGMDRPANYRNKAQFPVSVDREGRAYAGFYAGRTHSVIKTDCCSIEFQGHEKILEQVLDYINMEKETVYDEKTGKGKVRHIMMRKGFSTGEIMVVIVVNGRDLKNEKALTDRLSVNKDIKSIILNVNTKNTNVIMGKECRCIYGRDYIVDKIGEISFNISPLSFYQVNPIQTRVLYEKALEYAGLTGSETVWDLYCGIGTISLFLAAAAGRVYGVEIVEEAINNAKQNATLNGIENVEFFVGSAGEVYAEKKTPADVVVVDPPRKGLEEELITSIASMAPQRIVYVSCDPATLARDVRLFCEKGYEVQKVQPVDMFPGSVHVETVVLLTKVQK